MFLNEFFPLNHTSESGSGKLPSRSDIEEKYTWNLKDIYDNEVKWEADFKWVEDKIPAYDKFKGKLCESTENILNCLKLDDEVGIKLDRLLLYSMLAKDSDMTVLKYQSLDDRIKSLYSNVMAASSFMRPELLSIDSNKLLDIFNTSEELKKYSHMVDDLLRLKPFTLSQHEERILAQTSEITSVPYNTYSIFTNADLQFPFVKDENGKDVQVSHGRYYAALYSKNRGYRERVFKAYLGPYKSFVNSITVLFNGNLKGNIFYAKARNYKSAREAALSKNNIPIAVYDNLLDSVNSNLEPMHRWASLKKKILKLEELHPYDSYVTIFDKKLEKKYPYEDAKKIVFDSLQLMGNDYINSLQKAFENRWIDVYETKGKRSGAYSSGTTFGVHPYVLLNWTDLLNDVFTLAHEMGHNMHSYYTGISQPYHYANYSIFLAEVASTFNENLLLEYLIQNAKEKDEKLFLLEKYLNNITTTFYRQVMFAEFEKIVHQRTEEGEALTSETLCKLYKELYCKYWGPEMVVDEEEIYTWARVPHFYYNFYVYQYATGLAAAETLALKVKTEGEPAVKKYVDFLKAGSSDYPINILNKAGVDMSSPDPVLAVTKKMTEILDSMEKIL